MDLTAISLAKESKIPILVTNIFKRNCLISALKQTGKYSKISWYDWWFKSKNVKCCWPFGKRI